MKLQKVMLLPQDTFQQKENCKWHHSVEIHMERKGKIQGNVVLKVVNCEVSSRMLKYYQEKLAMSS